MLIQAPSASDRVRLWWSFLVRLDEVCLVGVILLRQEEDEEQGWSGG